MTFVYLWLLVPFALYGLGVWHGYATAKNEAAGIAARPLQTNSLAKE